MNVSCKYNNALKRPPFHFAKYSKAFKILTNKHKRLKGLHITPIEQEKNAFNPTEKHSIPPINAQDKKDFRNCYFYFFYKQQEKSSPLRK